MTSRGPLPFEFKLTYGQIVNGVSQEKYKIVKRELEDYECCFKAAISDLENKISQTVNLSLLDYYNTHFSISKSDEETLLCFQKALKVESTWTTIKALYPELVPLMSNIVNRWKDSWVIFAERFHNDCEVINRFFKFSERSNLDGCEVLQSDEHGSGNVLLLSFGSRQIVYKPRPLDNEVFYSKFAKLINENTILGHSLPYSDSINMGEYGWQNYVNCNSTNSDSNHFPNATLAGESLALWYLFGTSDLHHENIILNEKGFVPIDLETLFQGYAFGSNESAEVRCLAQLELGVFRSGMLFFVDPYGHDISVLGKLLNNFTGSELICFSNKMVEAFQIALSRLRDFCYGKFAWLESSIKALSMRFVFRSTQEYWAILQASYHPDNTKVSGGRWEFLKQESLSLSICEIEMLQKGVIPRFSFFTDDNLEKTFICNGLQYQSGFRLFKERLFCVDKDECQVSYIESSFCRMSSHYNCNKNVFRTSGDCFSILDSGNNIRELVEIEVDKIADILLKHHSLGTDGGIVWWTNFGEDKLNLVGPCGAGLYSGKLGISLFFFAYAKFKSCSALDKFAEAVFRDAVRDLIYAPTLSLYNGLAGYYFASYIISKIKSNFDVKEVELQINDKVSCLIENELDEMDLINGVSGVLGALSLYYHSFQSRPSLKLIEQCVKKLSSMKLPNDAGMSHGVSGLFLSCAIAKKHVSMGAGHSCSIKTLQSIASQITESNFLPNRKNWRDVRNYSDTDTTFWCHGAPGVLLSAQLSQSKKNVAIDAIKEKGMLASDCLCHGSLGNLEVLLASNSITHEQTEGIVAQILNRKRSRKKWLCGTPLGEYVPGFMTGISGIGYQLIRTVDNDVPSPFMHPF